MVNYDNPDLQRSAAFEGASETIKSLRDEAEGLYNKDRDEELYNRHSNLLDAYVYAFQSNDFTEATYEELEQWTKDSTLDKELLDKLLKELGTYFPKSGKRE